MGIEPTQPAWKAGTLPLSYTHISGGLPPTTYFASYIALPQATYRRPPIGSEMPVVVQWESVQRLVAPVGLEPNIPSLRGQLPKPLEDGVIKVRCLTHILRDISDNPPNFLWRYGYLSAVSQFTTANPSGLFKLFLFEGLSLPYIYIISYFF